MQQQLNNSKKRSKKNSKLDRPIQCQVVEIPDQVFDLAPTSSQYVERALEWRQAPHQPAGQNNALNSTYR